MAKSNHKLPYKLRILIPVAKYFIYIIASSTYKKITIKLFSERFRPVFFPDYAAENLSIISYHLHIEKVLRPLSFSFYVLYYSQLFTRLSKKKTIYSAFFKSSLDYLTYHSPFTPTRICCLILINPKKFLTFTKAVHTTWAPRCDRYFFITEYSPSNLTLKQKNFAQQIPIAPLHNIESGRDHLTQKSTSAFLFVYQHYFHDFDWFVKADDDTFLIMENLREFLRKQNPTEPITFGYNYKVIVADGYHSGGASYVLSREALRRFYEGQQSPNNTICKENHGAEDVEIAKCLRTQGVRLGTSLDEENRELFHPLPFHDHFRGSVPDWLKQYVQNPVQTHYNCCSDRTISFHYMSPDDQYYLNFLLYKVRLGS